MATNDPGKFPFRHRDNQDTRKYGLLAAILLAGLALIFWTMSDNRPVDPGQLQTEAPATNPIQ